MSTRINTYVPVVTVVAIYPLLLIVSYKLRLYHHTNAFGARVPSIVRATQGLVVEPFYYFLHFVNLAADWHIEKRLSVPAIHRILHPPT